MSDGARPSAVNDWLRCPYCGAGGERVHLDTDIEHVTMSCGFCGSSVTENHSDHERTGRYADGLTWGEP